MDQKEGNKTLTERLYNMNVLPIVNLRGSDLTDVVIMDMQDKSEENSESINEDGKNKNHPDNKPE